MKTPLTADKSTSDHTIPELINCGLVSRMPDTLSAVGGASNLRSCYHGYFQLVSPDGISRLAHVNHLHSLHSIGEIRNGKKAQEQQACAGYACAGYVRGNDCTDGITICTHINFLISPSAPYHALLELSSRLHMRAPSRHTVLSQTPRPCAPAH